MSDIIGILPRERGGQLPVMGRMRGMDAAFFKRAYKRETLFVWEILALLRRGKLRWGSGWPETANPLVSACLLLSLRKGTTGVPLRFKGAW